MSFRNVINYNLHFRYFSRQPLALGFFSIYNFSKEFVAFKNIDFYRYVLLFIFFFLLRYFDFSHSSTLSLELYFELFRYFENKNLCNWKQGRVCLLKKIT